MTIKTEAIHQASYRLRVATLADAPHLRSLIARSIRTLGAQDYTAAQIEAALTGAFGLDTSLIRDATYFVALDPDERIVGCGGWSRRRTLFGGDTRLERDDSWLDPTTDAAKIRAFFIDPVHARRGIGRSLLERCEEEVARAGFTRCELMATLPGQRLYLRYGYEPGTSIEHPLPGGLAIEFVPMRKTLGRRQIL
ncbi:MAG TPA: GNAT family N-acetyltransferase [Steroidobacteraceae bacterium]|nr:GNAT family N-acetyltransferase [Steroidobacteraceae bacterium]